MARSLADYSSPSMQAYYDAIDEEERRQGVPKGLGRAVAMQESYMNPNALGDNGKSVGFFQLQPAAAKDVGLRPEDRYDPLLNIRAGVNYLALKLKQSKGDIPGALLRYNGGGDPNYVQNVSRYYQPGGLAGAQRAPDTRYAAAGDTMTDLPMYQGSKTTGAQKAPSWMDAIPDTPPPEYRTGAPSPVTQPTVPGSEAAPKAPSWLDAIPDTPPPEYRTQPAMPPAAAPGAPPSAAAPQIPPAPEQTLGPPGAPVQRVDPGQFMREQAPAAVQAMQPPAYKPSGLPPEQQTLSERLAASEAGQNPNTPPDPSLLQRGASAVQAQVNPPASTQPLTPEEQKQRALASVDRLQAQQPASPTGRMFGEYDPSRTGKAVPAAIELGADVATGAAGAGAGFAVGGAPGMVAGPVIAQGALDRARMQLGLKPQEKAVFGTGIVDIYQSDLINGGMALFTGIPDLVRSALGKTYAGKAMLKANDDTKAAHNAWMESEAARQKAFDEKKVFDRETYDKKVAKRKDAYDAAAQKRNELIAKNQTEFDQATAEYQTAKLQRDAQVQDVDAANYYNTRRFQEEQAAYPDVRARQVAEAEAAAAEKAAGPVRQRESQFITETEQAAAQGRTHQEALTRAQALPEKYTLTGDASDIKYQRLRDVGKDEVVGVDTAKADLKQFLDEDYKHYLDESNAALPEQVKFHADQLNKLPVGEPVSVLAVHDAMKELGPLTRSKNGDVRRTASVLYGIYSDMLEQSPKVAELARDASQTFKREMAVKELGQRVGIGTEGTVVSRHPQGGYQINTTALQNRFDKAANNKLFRGAFDDEEWAALSKDIDEFSRTPGMPGPVKAPTQAELTPAQIEAKIPPETPPQMEKVIPPPKELGPEPVLKTREAPRPFAPEPFEETVAGRREFQAAPEPKAVEAQLDSPGFRGFLKSTIGQGSSIGGMAYMLSRAGLTPTAVDNVIYLGLGSIAAGAVGTTMNYAVSKALMTPNGRTLLKAAMGPGGRLDPNFFGGLVAVMSDAERAEFMREMPKEPEKKKGGR